MFSIIRSPSPILREISQPVETFDTNLINLINTMVSLTFAESGIGLSSVQLGVPKQIMIISEDGRNFQALCNLKIIKEYGSCVMQEGCLSVPGIYKSKTRAARILVIYNDMYGGIKESLFNGILARCILHEYSHWQGELLNDN